MTNPEYTAIMLLIDRSGSMYTIQQSAQESINEFIAGQRHQPGRRTIRLAQFDSTYELVHRSLPAAECPDYQLEPRASTALLDAMAMSIREFGKELWAMPEDERPGTVIWATVTDGMENSSVEHTWTQVQEMIRHQEDRYGWQVLYLGANQDAIATAARLGIQRDRSLTYSATPEGTQHAYRSASGYVAAASAGLPARLSGEDPDSAPRFFTWKGDDE